MVTSRLTRMLRFYHRILNPQASEFGVCKLMIENTISHYRSEI